MDDNRSYLSVTIPVHEYFISENKLSEKEMEYRRRIADILMESPLSRSELAEVVIAGKVKLCVSGKSHI